MNAYLKFGEFCPFVLNILSGIKILNFEILTSVKGHNYDKCAKNEM